jgi:large subunit ribosomal protein L15
MPLTQRLPKIGGFHNPFKKVFAVVNLTKLNRFEDGAELGPEAFYQSGIASKGIAIKLLGSGKLRRRLTIQAHAASPAARAAIEARGGTVSLIGPQKEEKVASQDQ